MRARLSVCLPVITLLATCPALAEVPGGAAPITMIYDPALSPDGKSMVFEWIEDLWIASTEGGEAKRIINHPARDAYPRFSPDGNRIIFSSDRSGSLQIWSVPTSGGDPVQHTWHTEGNTLECLSADGTRAIVRGNREAPGLFATRLMEIDLTGDHRERRLFDAPAHSASWSPDGHSVLFCRRGEQLYRKGYRGSRASQIWRYHIPDRSFEPMITEETETRSPLWMPDGKGFYYVSARDGTPNLWRRNERGEDTRLTRYTDDGVITPDLSQDGSTIVFRMGFGVSIYHPETDNPPSPIDLWTHEPLPDISTDTRRITGTISADFSPDLKQVVFSAAGELWLLAKPGAKPERLTKTSASEDEPRFSPDGTWLYFLRDDGLQPNYFLARLENGKLADESQITRGNRSKGWMKCSPDGSKIAWIEGNGDVYASGTQRGPAHLIFPCWDKPTFDWSPDGRWLAIAAEDQNANRDIWIARIDGSRPPFNLTRDPAFEGSPKWSPDGRSLVFSAKRDDSGKNQLWRIRFSKDGPTGTETAEMLPTKGIEPTRVIWAADSKSILFQSTSDNSSTTYQIDATGKNMRSFVKRRGIPIRTTPDGSLLWRIDRTPEILHDGKTTRFPISTSVSRPRGELLQLGFLRIWRKLGESFYAPDMNDLDWEAMRDKYLPAARSARNSRQLDRVISSLRGELNASHLAFTPRPWPGESRNAPKEDRTAHPGLVFQDHETRDDAPLRIARVIPGSPVSELPDPPKPGDIIVRIAGTEVTSRTPLHEFFNGAEMRPLPVVIRKHDGTESVIELRCISYRKARALETARATDLAALRVRAATPDTAYLSVTDMSSNSRKTLETRIYQASLTSKSLILDMRGNGGGREADRMLAMFCQPTHAYTIPRGGPVGYPVDRLPAPAWNKTLVVLCDQNTFSNAEIFCHAVKTINRAPLVGIPTAGGVISAVKTTIPDMGELQIPFRGWFNSETGANLDSRGAQPDHRIDLTPADEDAGRDPQLEKAIELLTK